MKTASLWWPVGGLAIVAMIATASLVAEAQQNTNPQDKIINVENVRSSWEYARMVLNDDVVAWQGGETNVDPEAVTLETLYRRLGGKFRPNLTNLLNLLGRDGWELVTTDETVWTFKRKR